MTHQKNMSLRTRLLLLVTCIVLLGFAITLTLLVVTHDAALGARAQRQIGMRDGRIIEDRRRERFDARG